MLKPCPFCGGEAKQPDRYTVKCDACGAEVNGQLGMAQGMWNNRGSDMVDVTDHYREGVLSPGHRVYSPPQPIDEGCVLLFMQTLGRQDTINYKRRDEFEAAFRKMYKAEIAEAGRRGYANGYKDAYEWQMEMRVRDAMGK